MLWTLNLLLISDFAATRTFQHDRPTVYCVAVDIFYVLHSVERWSTTPATTAAAASVATTTSLLVIASFGRRHDCPMCTKLAVLLTAAVMTSLNAVDAATTETACEYANKHDLFPPVHVYVCYGICNMRNRWLRAQSYYVHFLTKLRLWCRVIGQAFSNLQIKCKILISYINVENGFYEAVHQNWVAAQRCYVHPHSTYWTKDGRWLYS